MRHLSRIIIRGRVQGVGFRYWLKRQAAEYAIDGWTRNRPDGSVEAVLAGEAESVRVLIARCRSGPDAAAVTDVAEAAGAADAADAEDPGSGFRIIT